ncbi:hypothetical protein MNBD_GAMMA07-1811 [hydrothermal vent metagenome]|uniref:DUF6484 domain-containing protein n=1 Tax=hydrothermal vent metagenome TaxID=652676 RepID=A0A3B0WMH5_9ZZZZ
MEKNHVVPKENLLTEVSLSPGEILLGTFTGFDNQHNILVNFPNNLSTKSLIANSTLELNSSQIGAQVALMFIEGDINKPLIMGVIYNPLNNALASFDFKANTKIDDAHVDGKRILLEGKEEIVLKCGQASITLTKSGKILIRGNYLSNRSTGVNKILGGSVQIN